MGDGFIQLLVIGFFIIISMMDGAARKKKRLEAQRLDQIPEPDGPPGADDGEGLGEDSSEGMVPGDLWGEIAAMARGEHPAQRTEEPPLPGTPSTSSPRSEGRPAPRMREYDGRGGMQEYDGAGGMREYDGAGGIRAYDGAGGIREYDGEDGLLGDDPPDTVPEPERATVTWSPDGPPSGAVGESEPSELPHEHVMHTDTGMVDSSDGAARTSRGRGALREPMGRVASLRRAIVMAEVLRPPVALRADNREPYG